MSSETPLPAAPSSPTGSKLHARLLANWICPACTGVGSDSPGQCPKCGIVLERGALSTDRGSPDLELRSMTRRLVFGLILGIPLIGVGVYNSVQTSRPVSTMIGEKNYLVLQALICTPVVIVCGASFFVRAWRSLRTWRVNLYTLIGIGAAAAYVYSLVALAYALSGARPLAHTTEDTPKLSPEVAGSVEVFAPYQRGTIDPFFESAALIVLLGLLGQVLELRARERSGAAIRKLLPLVPRHANVLLPDGGEEQRMLDEVRPGDLVRVQPGERIPVDGIVKEGITTVDESMLTGEPTRAGRGPGARVLAGSENGLVAITVESDRVKEDTVLDQVISIVAQAQERRVTLGRTADRVAKWYLPLVLLIALGVFIGWAVYGPPETALTYAAVCSVAVLIVTCPIAVGLATPTAVVIGMRRAARSGVLFRDAAVLERLASVDTVLFDKTGTLTEGKPKLIGVRANAGVSENAVLAAAAAVERGSEHPLGLAIVWEAVRRGLEIVPADNVVGIPGKGVRGSVDGKTVVVGRQGFLQESGVFQDIMFSEALTHRQLGHGIVFVGEGNRCIGVIVMNDPIRATARAAADRLNAAGIRLVLLTGDHFDTARAVAQLVEIEEVFSDTLPVEKYAVVQKLKGEGRVVAMCGDGVNDAPALVAADVGIAMGTGTHAAIGAAGVTLAQSDLRSVDSARELSRATVRTIRQNLILAFSFNVLAIPIAAGALVPLGGGLVSSVWGIAAMGISSLLVILNSLRLAVRSV